MAVMDDPEDNATFHSFASSVSCTLSHQSNLEKRRSERKTSTLAFSVDTYLAFPSAVTFSDLHKLARKLSAQTEFFAVTHPTLCQQLLRTLAEHLLTITASAMAPDVQEETSTQYLQPTQTQQSSEDLLQLLELCFLFGRKSAVGYPSHALRGLLRWLVDSISVYSQRNGCETDIGLKMQLLVLAELIESSAGIRIYVKEMKSIKGFYRSLTILLNSTEEAEVFVFSTAILARLVLLEPIGSKLFSDKNVDQAYSLIFSVLDGPWSDKVRESILTSTTILGRRSLLPIVSVDLLCDLATCQKNLDVLETYPKVKSTLDSCLMSIDLNADVEHTLVAAHFLSSIVQVSHLFRKNIIDEISDQDVLFRLLQATLHPSKLAAATVARLVLTMIGNDNHFLQSIFDFSVKTERLYPALSGMIRCIADINTLVVQGAVESEELSNSDAYLHAVELCLLLTKLSKWPAIRTLCVETISLNQSASLIRMESALISRIDPHNVMRFRPQLSIYLVSLLSSLTFDGKMSDKNKLTLRRFLQTSEVALVLSAALFNGTNKEIIAEALLLLQQLLSSSENIRLHAIELAEGIIGYDQRIKDGNDSLQLVIDSLQTNAKVSAATIKNLEAEIKIMLLAQNELKAKQEQAIKNVEVKFTEQMRLKEDSMRKQRDAYEVKLNEITIQCESMGQHMNQTQSALQQRDSLLHESRAKRGIVEEENRELKRKLHVLEARVEEITQLHRVAVEETKLGDNELIELRAKFDAICKDYTAQREELDAAYDAAKRLEDDLCEQKQTNENTYKELVLLSKAHKALCDEKKKIETEMYTVQRELSSLNSLNISIKSQLQEKIELADRLEQKIARLKHEAIASKNTLEDEQEKCQALSRDHNDLRKAHRKLEEAVAQLQIEAAEQRFVVEAKDELLRKGAEKIRLLTEEVEKQANLQALIHKLSSGVDNNINIGDGS